MAATKKIQVKNISKSFGNHHVLKGINLDIEKDSSMVILGGSGTGKSVLIKTIIGLLEPDSGNIIINGQSRFTFSEKERLDFLSKCGFLFQGGALFDSLTVWENIVFFAEKISKLSKKDKLDLASEKLKLVGLPDRILNLFPSELSGGMQKRVSLARAICTNPEIIFFDEPTTGLDPIMASVINELIIKVREELGATTITITHDMISARMIGQDFALMHMGEIIWRGKGSDLDKKDNKYLYQFVNGKTEGPITV